MRGRLELFTTAEMARADGLAVSRDVASRELMENAGAAVAAVAVAMIEAAGHTPATGRPVLVLCGRGNNGGDGFVAARRLMDLGLVVRVALMGSMSQLRGDAAMAAADWPGLIETASPESLRHPADLVIDALLGAGLTGPLRADAAAMIAAVNGSGLPVLSIDVPSGLDGTSGEIRSIAVKAQQTITFVRRKPGHMLLPGRLSCGAVEVADIGMPESVVADIAARAFANHPDLWRDVLPVAQTAQHKYDRGHAVVVAGPPDSGGAARLAARAALRIGAGVVTLASPADALPINACQLTAVMVRAVDGAAGLGEMLADRRKNAVLVGPGNGIGEHTLEATIAALRSGAATVIDADAITSAARNAEHLFANIGHDSLRPVVLTPHEGEFARLFPGLTGSKLERARAAAAISGAVIVLKGPDTVIADREGRATINENAPPSLATAGSGDVLAGMITGLLAQGMPGFEAAAAAVWMHGEAANAFGPGLIAEDLSELLPAVLRQFTPAN